MARRRERASRSSPERTSGRSEQHADDVANSMRELGDLARIVHKPKGYELFLREGRKKKINKRDIVHDDYIPDGWESM